MILGTRAVQNSIIEAHPGVDIAVYIIWTIRLENDSEETTIQAIKGFGEDPRVFHFYDPKQHIGKLIVESLNVTEDEAAWDVYLFYKPGKEWREIPPIPDEWLHQLTESEWADPRRYHTGDDLVEKLEEVMDVLVNKR